MEQESQTAPAAVLCQACAVAIHRVREQNGTQKSQLCGRCLSKCLWSYEVLTKGSVVWKWRLFSAVVIPVCPVNVHSCYTI